ncbi:ornithine decarboxylase antizyme 1-like, partial [Centruroides sculpturatus]|uniref:ornithine decarboxylase antizyme 1-like n=1 Tax=Centruroides sculpturatus TaxID=218467 RepID=UPI000C6E9081
NVIVYPWGQGLSGVPDVPHAADVSLPIAEGSGVGKLKVPPVIQNHQTKRDDLTRQSYQDTVLLTFRFHLTELTNTEWEAVLWQGRLYVQVPSGILPEGSKETFVCLLEYAEEDLRCTHIVVCFEKNRTERAVLVRTFMFLGFVTLAPGHPLAPRGASEDTLYMAYAVE